jgi:predicted O-methyltransferase YrrM
LGVDAADRLRQVRERRFLEDLAPVAIGADEGAALREWVRREGARRTVETGLGFAVSTLFICEGLLANGGDIRHVAIDPYQFETPPGSRTTYAGIGVATLEEAGVRNLFELQVEPSETALPRLLAEGRTFDLAFVDGNHRFEGVFLDLLYCGRLLRPGGVVFADDAQLPAVRRAISFFVVNLGWAIEAEGREGGHEWAVVRTSSGEAFRRPFDSFVEF